MTLLITSAVIVAGGIVALADSFVAPLILWFED